MGYQRKIGQALAGLSLGVGSAAVCGGMREPLVVSRLGDPESQLLTLDGSLVNPTPEQRNAAFADALAAAISAREAATDAQCRSTADVPAGGEARMRWEANCRYRRR